MPKSSARSLLGITLCSDYLRACLGLLFILLDTCIDLQLSEHSESRRHRLTDFVSCETNRENPSPIDIGSEAIHYCDPFVNYIALHREALPLLVHHAE